MKLNYSPIIAELTYMDPRPEVHTKQVQRFPAYPGPVLIKLWGALCD